MGIERLLIVADEEGALAPARAGLDAFVVDALGGGREALVLVHELREAGLRADRAYGDRSMKAQLKLADRSGTAYSVILGGDEFARDAVAVKDMHSGAQVEVSREQLIGWLRARREFAR
jgi:histidyl-tRNA synthetase